MLSALSGQDQDVVLAAIKAVSAGRLIAVFELEARIGVERDVLLDMIGRWPDIDDSADDSSECLAINNCLNDLAHGVSATSAEWNVALPISRDRIKEVYRLWAVARGWRQTGVR